MNARRRRARWVTMCAEPRSHRGPWPKISVWHGTADTVVRPSNADHIIRQWLDVQKLPERASSEEQIGRHTRRVWKDANGDTAA